MSYNPIDAEPPSRVEVSFLPEDRISKPEVIFGSSKIATSENPTSEIATSKIATVDDTKKLEKFVRKKINQLTKRLNWILVAVIIALLAIMSVFATTSVLVALDYLKYNYQRHEEYLDKINKVNEDLINTKSKLEFDEERIQELERKGIILNDTIKSQKEELNNEINNIDNKISLQR